MASREALATIFRQSAVYFLVVAASTHRIDGWWYLQVQCNYGGDKLTLRQRFALVLKERGGFRGLYRGITPGTCRSLLSNGTSFVVMTYAQKKITQLGLRDWIVWYCWTISSPRVKKNLLRLIIGCEHVYNLMFIFVSIVVWVMRW